MGDFQQDFRQRGHLHTYFSLTVDFPINWFNGFTKKLTSYGAWWQGQGVAMKSSCLT